MGALEVCVGVCTPRDCFIVQPAVLEHIIRKGTPEQREWALETLVRDHSIRTARLQDALIASFTARPVRPFLESVVGTLKRIIYDAKGSDDPEATDVVRTEGGPDVADPAVNESYAGFGATWKLYWEVYKRNSIDDMGLTLEGVVHYSQNYDNAFWNGSRMIFGDGDGQFLVRTTGSVDVIGHELTHGVTQYTANLAYTGQSGALNESVSDVFGSLVKQYQAGQTADQADWLIGAGIIGPAMNGKALRSMSHPGTAYDGDSQPADMSGYVQTTADNGGVHTNSGIPNCAFYHVAVNIGGHAWEKAGQIWYDSLRDPRLTANASFQQFADITMRNARHLYGTGVEAKAVAAGWKAVGIVVS
ncbi:MAG TPA: M4 family metallopeptidase [Candidatus Dormibacteraeota bacterium]|nr:M4 family metallopeptidase [Candidatus Dormibacteraeota bacterium]